MEVEKPRSYARPLGVTLAGVAALAGGALAVREGRRILGLGTLLGRVLLTGVRQPLWTTPADAGLPYEEVEFPSEDGVRLRGWFIPPKSAGDSGEPAPAVVQIHGAPWNRLGDRVARESGLAEQTVDLLVPAAALHRAGIGVLLFDVRNHGTSGADRPVTVGFRESRDLVGAVRMLRGRRDVAPDRLGVLGFSMGANTTLMGIPRIRGVRAAVVVMPVKAVSFVQNMLQSEFRSGPFTPVLMRLAETIHRAAGAPAWKDLDPSLSVAGLKETEVMYVQAQGDPWGSPKETREMANATPRAKLEEVPGDRYDGYAWIMTHAGEVADFFQKRLSQ